MEPEKKSLEKEIPFGFTIIFRLQPLNFGGGVQMIVGGC